MELLMEVKVGVGDVEMPNGTVVIPDFFLLVFS